MRPRPCDQRPVPPLPTPTQVGGPLDLPRLPPKRLNWFGGAMSEKQIDERRLQLEEYLQLLVLQLNWSLDDSLRSFLGCDEWLKPRKSTAEKTPHTLAGAKVET